MEAVIGIIGLAVVLYGNLRPQARPSAVLSGIVLIAVAMVLALVKWGF